MAHIHTTAGTAFYTSPRVYRQPRKTNHFFENYTGTPGLSDTLGIIELPANWKFTSLFVHVSDIAFGTGTVDVGLYELGDDGALGDVVDADGYADALDLDTIGKYDMLYPATSVRIEAQSVVCLLVMTFNAVTTITAGNYDFYGTMSSSDI